MVLLALMFALLPLRGWAANAMAIDMATQIAMQAATQVKAGSVESAVLMPADCTMHRSPATDSPPNIESTTLTSSGFCSSCDTCELCLAVAHFIPVMWTPDLVLLPVSRLAAGASFTSAIKAASLKPPIF